MSATNHHYRKIEVHRGVKAKLSLTLKTRKTGENHHTEQGGVRFLESILPGHGHLKL